MYRKKLWCNFKLFWLWFLTLKQEDKWVNFNKDLKIQACNFIQKRFQHRCFPVTNLKFLRIPILKNICEWLPLKIYLGLLICFLEDLSECFFYWTSKGNFENLAFKLLIPHMPISKQVCSLDQYCWCTTFYLMSRNVDFVFYDTWKT